MQQAKRLKAACKFLPSLKDNHHPGTADVPVGSMQPDPHQ